MRVTATHIESWAQTRNAQAQLPLLVRRLVRATTITRELVMPGGDSIGEPGWDGTSNTTVTSPWVPEGLARWEMGCSINPREKACDDLAKRVFLSSLEDMSGATFVFVTPRRWRQRRTWVDLAQQTTPWQAVHVIDADDLEAWLESAPAVALWFGELLGLSGSGIESVCRFWQSWRTQSKFPLTTDALLVGRNLAAQSFDKLIGQRAKLIVVQADSQEEAVAFACVRLSAIGLSDRAACVVSPDGWRFVDANDVDDALRIGIACSTDVAATRSPREGFTLVVPSSRGDPGGYSQGAAAGAANRAATTIKLERPETSAYESELRKLGEEPSDAVRLARTTGRSWSVYRRVSADNPAIRCPKWLDHPAASTLLTLTLIGAWNSNKRGDRACLEAISGCPYDGLEADLQALVEVDDSPVIRIGSVWRAKAPLELLHLCAPRITESAMTRYLEVTERVLVKPDPALELDDDQRWMAAVYGKVRDESGIVIDALVDSLAKLSVYAERRPADNSNAIAGGVRALVARLLSGADGERWLSLSGVLRELAEAAPDEFLSAVETSLRRADAPVRRLLTETSDSGIVGRCWHSNLLWALELLAWSAFRLHRVAAVLAKLSSTPIRGNWSNTPARSLLSLLRPWWPQTLATTDRCLAVLDRLIADHNNVAWKLLIAFLPRGSGWTIDNAAPRWRDDDAGRESLRGTIDLRYLSELGLRAIAQASGHPARIANLVASLDSFAGEYQTAVIHLVEGATGFDDDGRLLIQDSLRTYLNWHNSHNLSGERKSRAPADRLQPCFDALSPKDVLKRNLWLFASFWVDLPQGREHDHEQHQALLARKRSEALALVVKEQGWPGIDRLVTQSGLPGLVGKELGRAEVGLDALVKWVLGRRAISRWTPGDPVLLELLAGMPDERRAAFMELAISALLEQDASNRDIALLFANAPMSTLTWRSLQMLDEEVQRGYWISVIPNFYGVHESDFAYVVAQLLDVERHRTAFQVVMHKPQAIDTLVLKQILEGMRSGLEPDGLLPDGWHVGEAIHVLESAGAVERRDLAMLEFGFYGLLERSEHGARNLLAELLSDPALFIECIRIVYKPSHGTAEGSDDSLGSSFEVIWRLLYESRGVPGLQNDGTIDADAFTRWVVEVRRLASSCDRSDVADRTIGSWLSSCKADPDGLWPPMPIRDLLDQEDADEVRTGFAMGLQANRGVTIRAYNEGGDQELALASKYRMQAATLADNSPRAAGLLISLAEQYEREARQEDNDANLRRERS